MSPAAVRRVTDGPNNTSTPVVEKSETPKASANKRRSARKSISVVSPAVGKDGEDEDGQIVKKGDEEYHVVMTGIKDTGLTGKYWSDMSNLTPRRKCTMTPPPPASPSTSEAKKSTPPKKGQKAKGKDAEQATSPTPPSSGRGRKRKADDEASSSNAKQAKGQEELNEAEEEGQVEDSAAPTSNGTTPAGPAQRNISCLSDQAAVGANAPREVVVECFAPYDDHRWVNIGKEKNGMAPDAVQYARALRPPYQLLSFLRIKGNCAKGMGCSNKNTMVFVVLEGEITVVIHTTQFTAKKGDSFYIPPKNYYNLINNKARDAELTLLQYQYSGPLPSVPAGSQSGQAPTAGAAANGN